MAGPWDPTYAADIDPGQDNGPYAPKKKPMLGDYDPSTGSAFGLPNPDQQAMASQPGLDLGPQQQTAQPFTADVARKMELDYWHSIGQEPPEGPNVYHAGDSMRSSPSQPAQNASPPQIVQGTSDDPAATPAAHGVSTWSHTGQDSPTDAFGPGKQAPAGNNSAGASFYQDMAPPDLSDLGPRPTVMPAFGTGNRGGIIGAISSIISASQASKQQDWDNKAAERLGPYERKMQLAKAKEQEHYQNTMAGKFTGNSRMMAHIGPDGKQDGMTDMMTNQFYPGITAPSTVNTGLNVAGRQGVADTNVAGKQTLQDTKPLDPMKDLQERTIANWQKQGVPDAEIYRRVQAMTPQVQGAQIKVDNAPDPNRARADKSYGLSTSRLDKLADPINQRAQRLSTLVDTVNQSTPQADALIAPELLTVMAGGQGSGLRMNEAEIARIVGGRTNWEGLKAALNKWQVDPSKGLSITPAQRAQVRSLIQTVNSKIGSKQDIINNAKQQLIDEDDPHKQRSIVNSAEMALAAVDRGQGQVAPTVTTPPGTQPPVTMKDGTTWQKDSSGQWQRLK